MADNITYGGVLPADQVPKVLTRGFGLIWDGDSVETCKGGFGEYLRYNNPHKLSLYLSSGLPVEKNKVGYAIESLKDIHELLQEISKDEYIKIAENVRKLSQKLANGNYMRLALNKTVGLMRNED